MVTRQGSGDDGRLGLEPHPRRDAKLMEYKVPMWSRHPQPGRSPHQAIRTSSAFRRRRRSRPSAFAKIVDNLHIKKADFLVINNDWGIGTAEDFGKMFKEHGITVGLVERMDQSDQDMSAQLAKFKASDADTLIIRRPSSSSR